LSQSRSNNRGKVFVYFLIRRTTSEYLARIVYSRTTTVFPQIDAPGSCLMTRRVFETGGIC